jgi:hyperosmotically inducible periplasmic protein
MTMRRSIAVASLVGMIGAVAATPGCGGARRPPSVGISLDDATLTVRVKTALLNDPAIGGLKIDVTTARGAVTLSGTVPTRDDEAAAVALAKSVEGVGEVKSTLQIQP